MRILATSAFCMLLILPAIGWAQEEPPPPAPPAVATPESAPDAATPEPAEAAKAAPALHEVVPGWPDFPEATLVVTEERGPGDGWQHGWKRRVRVTAHWEDVRRFYADRIAAEKWNVMKVKEKPGEVEWELVKDHAEVEVEVEAKPPGSVEIRLERRDR